jgi:hypothetical protein
MFPVCRASSLILTCLKPSALSSRRATRRRASRSSSPLRPWRRMRPSCTLSLVVSPLSFPSPPKTEENIGITFPTPLISWQHWGIPSLRGLPNSGHLRWPTPEGLRRSQGAFRRRPSSTLPYIHRCLFAPSSENLLLSLYQALSDSASCSAARRKPRVPSPKSGPRSSLHQLRPQSRPLGSSLFLSRSRSSVQLVSRPSEEEPNAPQHHSPPSPVLADFRPPVPPRPCTNQTLPVDWGVKGS